MTDREVLNAVVQVGFAGISAPSMDDLQYLTARLTSLEVDKPACSTVRDLLLICHHDVFCLFYYPFRITGIPRIGTWISLLI